MKSAFGNFVARSTIVGILARDPFIAALLTGIALWSGLGFAVGFTNNFDVQEGAIYAVIAALTIGGIKGAAGGLLAREHIGNRRYREDVHTHPLLCAIPMQIIGFLPYPTLLQIAGIIPGDFEFAVIAVVGSLFCAAVGALGHGADSRGWDVFWHGGGLTGLVASKLDNLVHGPSPIDA